MTKDLPAFQTRFVSFSGWFGKTGSTDNTHLIITINHTAVKMADWFLLLLFCNSWQARGAVCIAVQEKLRDLHPAIEADVWEWSDADAVVDLAHGGPGDCGPG